MFFIRVWQREHKEVFTLEHWGQVQTVLTSVYGVSSSAVADSRIPRPLTKHVVHTGDHHEGDVSYPVEILNIG